MADDSATRVCVDCGTPLVHAENQGRWPERCPEHRYLQDLKVHRENLRARKAVIVEPTHYCLDCDEVLVKSKTKWPLRCKMHAVEHTNLQRRLKGRLAAIAAVREEPSVPCRDCGAPIAKRAGVSGYPARRCPECSAREICEQARLRREVDPDGMRAAEARWRENNRDKVAKKNWSRRALRLGLEAEDVLPEVVFERDNKTCQICFVPVDMSLRCPHPGSPELDHIFPVSRGGSHTYDNVRLAHRICNLRKGAKVS